MDLTIDFGNSAKLIDKINHCNKEYGYLNKRNRSEILLFISMNIINQPVFKERINIIKEYMLHIGYTPIVWNLSQESKSANLFNNIKHKFPVLFGENDIGSATSKLIDKYDFYIHVSIDTIYLMSYRHGDVYTLATYNINQSNEFDLLLNNFIFT